MAKRGGLGRGLDALIPDRKSDKLQKTIIRKNRIHFPQK